MIFIYFFTEFFTIIIIRKIFYFCVKYLPIHSYFVIRSLVFWCSGNFFIIISFFLHKSSKNFSPSVHIFCSFLLLQ